MNLARAMTLLAMLACCTTAAAGQILTELDAPGALQCTLARSIEADLMLFNAAPRIAARARAVWVCTSHTGAIIAVLDHAGRLLCSQTGRPPLAESIWQGDACPRSVRAR